MKGILKPLLAIIWGLLFSTYNIAQTTSDPLLADEEAIQKQWVDSVYNKLSLSEKVGQLFMVQAFSNELSKDTSKINTLIKDESIGGLIFSKGGPGRQAVLTNKYQKSAKIPLLIGMDAEWGLSMRLDSTYAFPWNMTLGAVADTKLIEATGKQLGQHCKRLGVHFNFDPSTSNVIPMLPMSS